MKYLLLLSIVWIMGCGDQTTNPGDVFFEDEKYAQAVNEYSKLIESDPSNVNILYNRGRAYEELGKLDLAEKDFLTIVEKDARHLNSYLSLSKLYYRQTAYNKAVIFADKALEINENSAQGHFLGARAKHQLGYVDAALESYNLAINVNRDYGDAYLYRGALKIYKNQVSSACDDFLKAMNLDVKEASSIRKKYCK